MLISYYICVLFCAVVLSKPLEKNENLLRAPRSPTFKKKGPIGALLGGLVGNGGSYGGQGGVNNYININNYGPHQSYPQTVHNPHQTVDYGHDHGNSYAGSAAIAGGHGSSQSQSQSASFSFGPYGGSFSQSQAQSRGGGFYDY